GRPPAKADCLEREAPSNRTAKSDCSLVAMAPMPPIPAIRSAAPATILTPHMAAACRLIRLTTPLTTGPSALLIDGPVTAPRPCHGAAPIAGLAATAIPIAALVVIPAVSIPAAIIQPIAAAGIVIAVIPAIGCSIAITDAHAAVAIAIAVIIRTGAQRQRGRNGKGRQDVSCGHVTLLSYTCYPSDLVP